MTNSDFQQSLIILILSIACVIYLWVLIIHSKSEFDQNPLKLHNGAVSAMGNYFNVIKLETQLEFNKFMEDFKAGQSNWEDGKGESSEAYSKGWSSYKAKNGAADDFFLDLKEEDISKELEPIVPSKDFYCSSNGKEIFVTIRSELNYKYLWMHGTEDYTMSATATLDTPLHLKTFQVQFSVIFALYLFIII